jgi:hypothetical protein
MRIFQDFLEADHAASFYIRLILPENFKPEITLENNKTNEKLVVKVKAPARKYDAHRLLISRRSSKVAKNKIEEEEKEITEWSYYGGPRRICLTRNYD